MVTPMHVLGDGAGPDAARAGDTTGLARSSGNIRLPTPTAGLWTQLQARRRWKDVAVDKRGERRVGAPAAGAAAASRSQASLNGVVREVAARSWSTKCRGMIHDRAPD